MKCPECRKNVKRGREGMRCSCGYEFRIDPKTFGGFTDGKFLALVQHVSGNDTWYFTPNQLWSRYCRKHGFGCLPIVAVVTVVWLLIVGFSAAANGRGLERALKPDTILIGLTLPIALFGIAAILRFRILPNGGRRKFDAMLSLWEGDPRLNRMIREPSLHQPPPDWQESDIYDYGVERILIVDQDLYVDWLVLNGFHAQGKALVLSIHRYPEYLVDRTRRILEDHPETPIFLLHDATAEGMAIESRLKLAGWLPLEGRKIVDLGLTPEDTRRMKGLRHLKPHLNQYEVPLDMLAYPMLAAGLTQALMEELPLGQLMERPATQDGSGGDGGSFG